MNKNFELLKQLWSNKHFVDVNIKDHIDELKAKDTYMKMIDVPKDNNEFRDAFNKECIDLYLLLKVKFSDKSGQNEVNNRINNIIHKIEKGEHHDNG
jgi:hypothetical protein